MKRNTRKFVDHVNNIKRGTSSFFINTALIIISIISVYPIIWMIFSSFKTTGDFDKNPVGIPKKLNFENYIHIIKESLMLRFMLNSAVITFISLTLILLIGFVTGYLLSRVKFMGRNILYSYYIIGILIPVHSLLVPIYILTNKIGLVDNIGSLILPYVAFSLPIAVFLIESYVRNIPKEMEEAANIDGASFARTMFMIILPVCKPILITVGIIQLFYCWNEFIFALVLLNDPNKFTVPLGLTMFKGPYADNYPMIMSGIIVSIIPITILYFVLSGNIIKSMAAGAVKG